VTVSLRYDKLMPSTVVLSRKIKKNVMHSLKVLRGYGFWISISYLL